MFLLYKLRESNIIWLLTVISFKLLLQLYIFSKFIEYSSKIIVSATDAFVRRIISLSQHHQPLFREKVREHIHYYGFVTDLSN